jgi:hypothetical protein
VLILRVHVLLHREKNSALTNAAMLVPRALLAAALIRAVDTVRPADGIADNGRWLLPTKLQVHDLHVDSWHERRPLGGVSSYENQSPKGRPNCRADRYNGTMDAAIWFSCIAGGTTSR